MEDITKVFKQITYNLDDFLQEWIHKNDNENKIPNHYSNLNMYMDLKDNFYLDINFQKTNNQKIVYYNDFKSIKGAYKRVNIVIGKKNSLKAYNIHARNRKDKYELISYDIKRLIEIDKKVKGCDYFNSLWDIIINTKAVKSKNNYPSIMEFEKR